MLPFRLCTQYRLLASFRLPRLSTQPIYHHFSTTSSRDLRSSELTPSLLSSLRANPSRLWDDIHSTASFGKGKPYGDAPEQTGLNRLALTESDKQARDWFTTTTEKLGCSVYVDEIGNQFAIRPGLYSYTDQNPKSGGKFGVELLNAVAATFAGSHLDSQPQGGRFDGVLGVCAGIEMLRVLEENWIETEGPVGVVNWTNEEGNRWKRSMMGSGVWADGSKQELDRVWGLVDERDGKTVGEDLQRLGYLGDVRASATEGVRMAGHFEVHIEQAKRLERSEEKAAVVSGVQGYRWFTIAVKGREAHAGATPWEDRADAVYWASRIVVETSELVKQKGGLATVGCFEVNPGSVNVVPGEVKMTLDVRCESDEGLESIIEHVRHSLDVLEVESESGVDREVTIDMEQDFESKAMMFDPTAMACVEESAKTVTGKQKIPRLVSGAGHDSVNTAKHCPTAIIFVPCRDGVTHNIREWCSEEDCAIGASVLLQSVLRFDQWRHKQGHFA